jgi:hypothetical protein
VTENVQKIAINWKKIKAYLIIRFGQFKYVLHGTIVGLAVIGVIAHGQRVHPRTFVQIEQHLKTQVFQNVEA